MALTGNNIYSKISIVQTLNFSRAGPGDIMVFNCMDAFSLKYFYIMWLKFGFFTIETEFQAERSYYVLKSVEILRSGTYLSHEEWPRKASRNRMVEYILENTYWLKTGQEAHWYFWLKIQNVPAHYHLLNLFMPPLPGRGENGGALCFRILCSRSQKATDSRKVFIYSRGI